MIGFIEHMGHRYFGPHYWGPRYWDIPIPLDEVGHRVFPLPAVRLATVPAAVPDAAAGDNLVSVAPAVRLVRSED